MANKLLTDNLSAPLGGATTARVDINTASGNLTIDRLIGGAPLLASGTLQYLENQGAPACSVSSDNGQATLTLRGKGTARSGFRFPWSACNGAYEWQVHLNPTVASDITAHSGGGNVRLDLTGMLITRLSADAGGGNVNVVLPDRAADLCAVAKTGAGDVTVEIGSGITGRNAVDANTGAGNVVVRVPGGIAARIHATSGLGKVIVEPQLDQVNPKTFQSPDYDRAVDKIELTLHSGAGSVTVQAK